MKPILYVVIPCFNEQEVLPKTSIIFEEKVIQLQYENKVSEFSRILFVDDGSKDGTWEIIQKLSEEKEIFEGISLSSVSLQVTRQYVPKVLETKAYSVIIV